MKTIKINKTFVVRIIITMPYLKKLSWVEKIISEDVYTEVVHKCQRQVNISTRIQLLNINCQTLI